MGNIDFSVTTETSTVSFTSEFREDHKVQKAGLPTLHQALTDSIARIAGAYNIAGALEREVAKLQPLFDAFAGPGNPEGAKLVADLNIDAGTSFVDESHPHVDALKRSFGEAVTQKHPHEAPDYGVANMTPGEVQRLLEQKDRTIAGLSRDKEKLISNLRASEHTSRSKEADLVIRRKNISDLEEQNARLDSNAMERLRLKDAELGKLRSAVQGLQRLNEGLKTRNDNQGKTIQSMQERLDVFEAGAPGVADLQTRYSGLRIDFSQAADDHTRLQEERDIARQERDQKTNELKAQAEKINEAVSVAVRAIEADSGALSSEMIHKSDAVQHVMGIAVAVQ